MSNANENGYSPSDILRGMYSNFAPSLDSLIHAQDKKRVLQQDRMERARSLDPSAPGYREDMMGSDEIHLGDKNTNNYPMPTSENKVWPLLAGVGVALSGIMAYNAFDKAPPPPEPEPVPVVAHDDKDTQFRLRIKTNGEHDSGDSNDPLGADRR